mmetsp:Transcript_28361/g.28654  ORF Transcript_28361/g.28654 Transcript_28361/m.28654 type:complete len:423 (+) Transcript_28361:152-1420(+)|eukprot:CAMPEP_0182430322 /NCGR_PEP_ID=MMETSP1167-20130531/39426_1 /TAXON_ID=2988 /ORGANISM="Mallomonas Sp, Strain CCMP3275" /LENGTH=422 /DNA_ID=CAMNT_0024615279 /DNA_START=140 /DNA_END=1408 /DNA_ORIENTATION=+
MDSDVQEEHHRLLRALNDSINRESELLRQVRRMKEAMASAGLKLQLSVKLAHDDETTMRGLRRETLEAKKEAIAANKRASTAVELVQSLRLELYSLKRQLRSAKDDAGTMAEAEREQLQSHLGGSSPIKKSDAEVDAMMSRIGLGGEGETEMERLGSSQTVRRRGTSQGLRTHSEAQLNTCGRSTQKRPPYSAFQEWKIQRYLWTPDTPAASEFQDAVAVDALAATALKESSEAHANKLSPLRRSVKSSAAKTRPPMSHITSRDFDTEPLQLDDDDDKSETSQLDMSSSQSPNRAASAMSPSRSRRVKNSVLPTLQRASVAMEKLMRVDEEMQRFINLGTSNNTDRASTAPKQKVAPTLKSTAMISMSASNPSLVLSHSSDRNNSPPKSPPKTAYTSPGRTHRKERGKSGGRGRGRGHVVFV